MSIDFVDPSCQPAALPESAQPMPQLVPYVIPSPAKCIVVFSVPTINNLKILAMSAYADAPFAEKMVQSGTHPNID